MSWNKNGDLSGGFLIFSSVATNGSCSRFFLFCPPGRIHRTTAVRYGYKISQWIPIHTFFIFSKMTEAVCEDWDRHNAPINESCSQFVAPSGSSEQEPSLKEIDSRDILLLTETDVPGASLNNKDPSKLNVMQLKRCLAYRRALLTGKKPKLIET